MPKLSIITINLNNAKGLEKTLQSIYEQNNNDYEHIIIDGGSTDKSLDIIKKYSEDSVKTEKTVKWVSEKDTGIYHAMNKGIKAATGTYCLFLNSGDYLTSPNVLQKSIPATPLYDLVINDLTYSSGTGKEIHQKMANPITFHTLAYGNIPHCSTFIKRELFEKYGLYNEAYKIVSDHLFFLQLLLLHKVSYCVTNIPITHFDTTGISSQSNFARTAWEERQKAQNEVLPGYVWQFAVDYKMLEEKYNGMLTSKSVKTALFLSKKLDLARNIKKFSFKTLLRSSHFLSHSNQ